MGLQFTTFITVTALLLLFLPLLLMLELVALLVQQFVKSHCWTVQKVVDQAMKECGSILQG